MTAIRAVCFDVGGVMTRSVGPVFLRQAAAAGLEASTVKAAMWATFASEGDSDEPAHRLERGEITLDEFFALLGPLEPTARVLMDPASEYFVPAAFEAHDGMHAFFGEVHEMGMKTALISNVVDEWEPWWDAVVPPLERFDEVVYSCQVGLRKPNQAIYRLTMDRLGVAPEETLFLDDFPAMVDAARALGMVVVHVQDHEPAIDEARRLISLSRQTPA